MPSRSLTLAKRTYAEWSSHNAARLAAALACYTIMSIAPLLVVALTVAGVIYGHHAQANIGREMNSFVGTNSSISGDNGIINQMLATAAHSNHKLGAAIVSFIIALASATGLLVSVQDALNTIWDVTPKPDAGWRAMVRDRLISACLLFGGAILLIASVVLSTILSKIAAAFGGGEAVHWLLRAGDFLISIGVITALFAMVYRFLPDVKIAWSTVWRGAVLTAILFTLGKFGLAVYFRFAAVGSPFGAAGSLAALLIWIYYSSMLFFFGAAFTRAYADARGRPIEPNEYAVRVDRRVATAESAPAKPAVVTRKPQPTAPAQPTRAMPLSAGGAGFAAGALMSILGAATVRGRQRRITARIKELGLRDRLEHAQAGMQRAAANARALERMNIGQRISAVEAELRTVADYAAKSSRDATRRLRR